jgi:Zn-dependent alcohol dehydrogenase
MRLKIKKTKAAILYRLNKPLILDKISMPNYLYRGQVLVKMIYSGVCGSQLGEIQGIKGPDKFLPHLLGHEGIGKVVQVGGGVKKVKKNDYVLLHWMKSKGINSDVPKYLWKRKKLNSGSITTFSEHSIISENRMTKLNSLFAKPIYSLLGCTISTAIGAAKNIINKENRKSKTLIVGCGPIGLCIIKYLTSLGMNNIYAIDNDKKKLILAKEYGAREVYCNKTNNINELDNIDFIFECTGNSQIISSCFVKLSSAGTLILIGVPKYRSKAKFNTLEINLGKKIIGVKGGNFNPEKDVKKYIQIVNSKNFNKKSIKLNIFKFNRINKIFNLMKKKKLSGKAIIKF